MAQCAERAVHPVRPSFAFRSSKHTGSQSNYFSFETKSVLVTAFCKCQREICLSGSSYISNKFIKQTREPITVTSNSTAFCDSSHENFMKYLSLSILEKMENFSIGKVDKKRNTN